MNLLPPGIQGTRYGSGCIFSNNSCSPSRNRRDAAAAVTPRDASNLARSFVASSLKMSRSIAHESTVRSDSLYNRATCEYSNDCSKFREGNNCIQERTRLRRDGVPFDCGSTVRVFVEPHSQRQGKRHLNFVVGNLAA